MSTMRNTTEVRSKVYIAFFENTIDKFVLWPLFLHCPMISHIMPYFYLILIWFCNVYDYSSQPHVSQILLDNVMDNLYQRCWHCCQGANLTIVRSISYELFMNIHVLIEQECITLVGEGEGTGEGIRTLLAISPSQFIKDIGIFPWFVYTWACEWFNCLDMSLIADHMLVTCYGRNLCYI